jgi:hypothetical protein
MLTKVLINKCLLQIIFEYSGLNVSISYLHVFISTVGEVGIFLHVFFLRIKCTEIRKRVRFTHATNFNFNTLPLFGKEQKYEVTNFCNFLHPLTFTFFDPNFLLKTILKFSMCHFFGGAETYFTTIQNYV